MKGRLEINEIRRDYGLIPRVRRLFWNRLKLAWKKMKLHIASTIGTSLLGFQASQILQRSHNVKTR